MKNAFFVFYRIKILFFALFCTFCSILFFACADTVSSGGSDSGDGDKNSGQIYELKGNLFVDGSFPKILEEQVSARSASAKVPGAIYYSVSAASAETPEKTCTAEVTGTAFSVKLSKGTWNITAEGFSDAEKTVSVVKGAAAVQIENENSVKSAIPVKMLPQTGGKGSLSLSVEVESASGIKSVLAELFSSSKENAVFSDEMNFDSASNSVKIEKSDVDSGVYNLSLKFYSEEECEGYLLYLAEEVVNIFDNLTTDTWQGNSVYFNGGKFSVTETAVQSFKMSTFFVQGASDITYTPAEVAEDSSAGTYFSPFATVQGAVDRITGLNDGTTEYTIYVDGTVKASSSSSSSSSSDFSTDEIGSTFIYIKSDSELKLKIKGFSSEQKAVIDANQSSTYGGNVISTGDKVSLTLENLKITGGKRSETGGGIYSKGNLTLKNCLVTKNISNNAGGGISFSGKELVLEDTEISENQSQSGNAGGISTGEDGKVTIKNCKINNNKANKNLTDTYGGGLYLGYNNGGTCEIEDTEINGNTAAGHGGGISFYGKTLTIKNSEVNDNTANNDGGGIYFMTGNDCEYTISGTTINKNSAKTGGGIYLSKGTLNLKSGTVIGEQLDPDNPENDISKVATSSDCGNKSTVTLDNNDNNNIATGAGLYISGGTVNMEEGVYICRNYTEVFGGGVCIISGTFNMNGGVIGWNFSRKGGGIYSQAQTNISGDAKICCNKAGAVENNDSAGNGAGIYLYDLGTDYNETPEKIAMTGGTICGNASEGNGAGIFIYSGNAGFSGCSIRENSAAKNGGAIYASGSADNSSRVKVTIGYSSDSCDTAIEENSAVRGGAVYCADNADFTMYSGSIYGNYSTGEESGNGGGAVFLWGGNSTYGTFTMNGGKISENTAKNGGAGGAVYIDHGDGTEKCKFIMAGGYMTSNKTLDKDGKATNLGGAIYLKTGGKILLGDSAVIAAESEGNDIYLGGSNKITVTSALSPEKNTDCMGAVYTARITPESYTAGTSLFETSYTTGGGSGGASEYSASANDYKKFCVTVKGSEEWYITDSGFLSMPTGFSAFNGTPDFDKYQKFTASSAAEMLKLSNLVSSGSSFSGTTVTLLDDITLATTFAAIGNSSNSFCGTFDGNGRTLTSNNDSLYSIFYQIGGGGSVKNLTSAGKFTYSGIVFNLYDGTVENCVNNAEITNTAAANKTAGIAAYMSGGSIKNCINKGKITNNSTGGATVGGICGQAMKGDIVNCTNSGSIQTLLTADSDDSEHCVGGIAGSYYAANEANGIFNCINLGDITSSYTTGTIQSKVGGILGEANNYDSVGVYINIKNCVNNGKILDGISMSSKGTVVGGCNTTSYTYLNVIKILNTYSLDGTTASGISGAASNIKINYFTEDNGVFKATSELTVGGTTSEDLIELLNAWTATNSTATAQYLDWKIENNNPALVYE